MLSILLPIYNNAVQLLVESLAKQCKDNAIAYEIICFDDGSQPFFIEKNRFLQDKEFIVYRQLTINIGRAAIRNRLSEAAKYDFLLFLDGDSKIIRPNFIQKYIDTAKKYAGEFVICGGRVYTSVPPENPKYYLHWLYGTQREAFSLKKRLAEPYHGFQTNNFLITKSLFLKIKFDEKIKQYGHEDTLFGMALKKKHISIFHIDNPLEHDGLETADIFLEKSEQAITNLFFLYKKNKDIDTRLLQIFKKIKYLRLEGFVFFFYEIFKNRIIKNLSSKTPNLYWFDFYKLGYFIGLL